METLWLFAIGLGAGVISGMGIGGGILLIPMLTLMLGMDQKVAQGINLLYFIPTAISALLVHHKSKQIQWRQAIPMMVTGGMGAGAGALLAMNCPVFLLRKLFSLFLLLVALYEIKLAFAKKSSGIK